MNKATEIRRGSWYEDYTRGNWVAYRCEPPYLGEHEYVRISAASVMGEPETYIFPADAGGKVTDWGELQDSFKGARDIARALAQMGYTEVKAE